MLQRLVLHLGLPAVVCLLEQLMATATLLAFFMGCCHRKSPTSKLFEDPVFFQEISSMKLTLLSLITILCGPSGFAIPFPEASTGRLDTVNTKKSALYKRPNEIVTGDPLDCRSCPKTTCPVVHQYPNGAQIHVSCKTDTDTTVVEDGGIAPASVAGCLTDLFLGAVGNPPIAGNSVVGIL
ncbi:hypothetical protein BU17DRAFT_66092 [Hysterangium stoloniferum]|nr:hypothetical protein BU17DRAFT_66092 [Hysterangium stoloniferum]